MRDKFKLFTLGPVEMDESILEQGAKPIPYFRTDEFSKIMLNMRRQIKKFVYTNEDSEAIFLTASGTGAMEASIINTFTHNDNLLIIVGGSFGKRFKQICDIYNIPNTAIYLERGKQLKKEELEKFRGKGFTGLLVNAHETSTGMYYDLPMIGEFCKEEGMVFVVDAISSFLADKYYMDKWNIGITILSSQKGLAIPPGISVVIVNKECIDRAINNKDVHSLYFDFKEYFSNIKRGQTPFTPAVGILLQLNKRLNYIEKVGANNIIDNTEKVANDFREKIKELPFTICSERLSNALTPLSSNNGVSAKYIFSYLKDNYNIYVCPNGGELKDVMFRVGHIGNLTIEDNDILINALKDMKRNGLI